MTTNRPEKLDEALIRPGRVDHQVAFGNATQTQIRELFERMYTNDLPRTTFVKSAPSITNGSAGGKLSMVKEKEDMNGHTPNGSALSNGHAKLPNDIIVLGEKDKGDVGEEELKIIAREFSLKVLDDMLSPAEIQGFLLKRKKDPRKALAEVENWVEGMVEVKRKGTKLVKVQ
jgi:chaperone BCS1